MRIGLNLLFLIPNEVGGTETYATSLINALAKLDRKNDYYLYINKEMLEISFDTGANFQRRLCPINARNRALRFLWEQLMLPFQARRDRIDIMHSLGYISPMWLPSASLVTIHDLNFLYIPEAYTAFTRQMQKLFVRGSASRADHVIVVSDFIRDQIIKDLGIAVNKVSAIPEAVDEKMFGQDPDTSWPSIQERHEIHGPFILALSSLSPHKNIDFLIKAFAQYKQGDRSRSKLVIGGHLPKFGPNLPEMARRLGIDGEVIFTGYLAGESLGVLLTNATLFVFPSLYEGFGLPVLEAMAAGTPVACARRGSLPEVAGDAAIYFDPADPGELAGVLSRVIANEELQMEYQKRGHANLLRFSWEKTAADTLAVYEKTCKGISKR